MAVFSNGLCRKPQLTIKFCRFRSAVVSCRSMLSTPHEQLSNATRLSGLTFCDTGGFASKDNSDE